MTKFGLDWWRMVLYWRLHLLSDFLMGPCAVAIGWVDWRLLQPFFGRRTIADRYDTWSMKFSLETYGKWANLCYGERQGK